MLGSFFQLVLMIAVAVGNTRRDLVEAAYTLGAGDRGVVVRVLLPSSAPEIAETLARHHAAGVGQRLRDLRRHAPARRRLADHSA